MNEVYAGFEWLVATLASDTTLQGYAPGGVWRSEALPGTATPFVILAHQSGVDVTNMNAFRLMVDLLYQVKAVGPAAISATIASAAARIDQLIGNPPTAGAVTGAVVLASYRQSPLFVDSLVNGEEWTDMGGLYRLEIQSTS